MKASISHVSARLARGAVMAAVAWSLMSLPGVAHHSGSQFDPNQRVTVAGVVTRVDWSNPHVWIYVEAKDDSGALAEWEFELPSVNRLLRLGWKRHDLNGGDRVTVTALRAHAHPTIGFATHVIDAEGRSLFVGSPRGEPQK